MIHQGTLLGDLISKFYSYGHIKFGKYILKSGIESNIYLDFRNIISYPALIQPLIKLLSDKLSRDNQPKALLAIPYSGLILASYLQTTLEIPLIYKRKEAKEYGTKKLFEGISCLKETNTNQKIANPKVIYIIDDILTTGSSILETLRIFRKLLPKSAESDIEIRILVMVDRRPESNSSIELDNISYPVDSLCTLREIKHYLVRHENISQAEIDLLASSVSIHNRFSQVYRKSSKKFLTKISKIVLDKKSNLIVSLDVTSTSKLILLGESLGPYISAIKIHSDIMISDTNTVERSVEKDLLLLSKIAKRENFLIIEDRKLGDIGNTTEKQLMKMNLWADAVTVHSIFGKGTLEAIRKVNNENKEAKYVSVFLIAESSSKNNLINNDYTQETIKLAEEYQDIVTGFIAQGQISENRNFLVATPGIHLENKGDNLEQTYKTPKRAICSGTDLIIVGRGIYMADDPVEMAKKYIEFN